MDNGQPSAEEILIPPPEVWGPHYWFVIHTFAQSYPVKPHAIQKEVAINFIKLIPFLLPCAQCFNHAFQYIQARIRLLDHIVNSRENLNTFFRDFHNSVNLRLGKEKY